MKAENFLKNVRELCEEKDVFVSLTIGICGSYIRVTDPVKDVTRTVDLDVEVSHREDGILLIHLIKDVVEETIANWKNRPIVKE